jgi:hypothetical protein
MSMLLLLCTPICATTLVEELTMGRGFPIISSTKQKLNTRSFTENELVGVDAMMPLIF